MSYDGISCGALWNWWDNLEVVAFKDNKIIDDFKVTWIFCYVIWCSYEDFPVILQAEADGV